MFKTQNNMHVYFEFVRLTKSKCIQCI